MIITTTEKLKEVCLRFSVYPFITIDTEFIRENTFFAQLCLIQIAIPTESYCIDPLSPDIDLQALYDLLKNKKVLKVFHSARQDLEIFYKLMNEVPSPVFDTQIGAMVCGFAENTSYQQLVHSLLSVTLDKGMRVTDWSKRPLSPAQEKYALSDVTYLCDVYVKLMDQIKSTNRLQWIEQETAFLYDEQLYNPDHETILKRINCSLSGAKVQNIYKAIYLWREDTARLLDRPRRQVLKDELLQDIARLQPKTVDDLTQLRGISSKFLKSEKAVELMNAIDEAKNATEMFAHAKKRSLSSQNRNLMELLRLLLTLISIKEKVAPRLIASQDDCVNYIEDKADVPFLSGWRYEIFGQYANRLRAGNLSFKYNADTKDIDLF